MCGVSRQAIGKSVKAKKIKMIRGKVDLDHRLTCEYYHDKTGKRLKPDTKPAKKKKVAPKPKPVAVVPPEPPPEPITAPVAPPPKPVEYDEDNGYALPPGIKNFEDITIHNLHLIPQDLIKKVKEFEVAAKAKQAREIDRGKLIKRELVKKIFAQIHTVDTNQWKTLEDKIMPELCGLFEVQDGSDEAIKARKLISEEVTKILRFVKRQIDEFFIDNEEVVR